MRVIPMKICRLHYFIFISVYNKYISYIKSENEPFLVIVLTWSKSHWLVVRNLTVHSFLITDFLNAILTFCPLRDIVQFCIYSFLLLGAILS